MKRCILLLAIVLVLGLSWGSAPAADAAATWRFAAGEGATCPKSIQATRGRIVVDLSALPKGAQVFRAVLRARRERAGGWRAESDKVVVCPAEAPQQPLPLLRPRYTSLDATAPVAAAVKAGKDKAEFLVKAFRWWKPETTCLDVSFTGAAPKAAIPKTLALTARHGGGQTLLSWTEPEPATRDETMDFTQWRALRVKLGKDPRKVTYRIYRCDKPISVLTIASAQLVDEVGRLTCWNGDFHGISPAKSAKLLRYVVEDGKPPAPPGTGIYAHNPAKAGKAYYAVSVAVNGEEDLAAFGKGNAMAAPVTEKVGPGDPVLQRIEGPKTFFYTKGITLHYYTRWEAPPRCNLPSRPYDYLVVVPEKPLQPAPLNLVLHCWGSNLYGKGGAYTWFGWKDRTRGIGVASNQIPYDWWTCYHESLHTWKSWAGGVTRDFTTKRLLAFVDWVGAKWDVDATRICVSGESMGGSGSTFMPIRYPDRFAYAYSAVGIHNPIAIKGGGFYESYAGVCGAAEANVKHESGMPTFDYLNDPLLVRKNPKARLPFIGFGNGKNDHGIGWPHAVDLAKALQQARQPHAVVWRLRGHGSGTFYPGIDFRSDQSLPAFTRCSLDDDIGTATKIEQPKKVKMPWGQIMTDIYDGDGEGGINIHLRWKTDDVLDEPDRWEMTVYLTSGQRGAPKDECSVDVTPRRCRKFKPEPGRKFQWTNTSIKDGKVVQSSTVVADKHALVTMDQVTVTKGGNRLRLAPAR